MKPRSVEFRRLDFKECAVVPLGRFGDQVAIVLREDYEKLIANGLSGNWFVSGVHNVMARQLADKSDPDSKGQSISVARLIMGAKAKQTVQYRDGNGRNLRRENLRLVNHGFAMTDCENFRVAASLRRVAGKQLEEAS